MRKREELFLNLHRDIEEEQEGSSFSLKKKKVYNW